MRIFLAFAVLLCATATATAANAQSTQIEVVQMQLVGVTTSQLKGNQGVFTMTTLCVAEVAPDSRMCTTAEVWNTISLFSFNDAAWLRPVLAFADLITYDRTTGISGAAELSCIGSENAPWQSTSNKGLGLNSDGRIRAQSCDNSQPIACCAFRAIATP